MAALLENDEFKWDVFVSYSWNSPDHSVAELLYESLRDDGLKVWKDNHVAQAGEKIMANIIHGLEKSRCVVALISPNYLKSQWCSGEVFMSHASGSLLPIAYGVEPKDMPLDVPATLAIPLKNEVQDVPTIVTQVKNFVSQRTVRRGLLERPFPVPEDFVAQFLGTMANWPPDGSNPHMAAGRIRRAVTTIKSIPQLKQAVVDYNHPSTLVSSLQIIQAYFEERSAQPEQWKALAYLAQPFVPSLAAYALESAGAIDLEYTQILGVSQSKLKAAYSISDNQRFEATKYVREIKLAMTNARIEADFQRHTRQEVINPSIPAPGQQSEPSLSTDVPTYPFSPLEWASWVFTAALTVFMLVERCSVLIQ